MVNTDEADHCTKDALTSFLGYMLQAVLAGLAFTCLIGTSHNLHLMLLLFVCVRSSRDDFSYLSMDAHVYSLRK